MQRQCYFLERTPQRHYVSASPESVIAAPADITFSVYEKHNTFADGPPPLCYPIETKKTSLLLNLFAVIFANAILPVTIFYVLHYVFNSTTDFIILVSQIPMSATLCQFPYRLWLLMRRKGERSPRDRGRLTWDFSQWQHLFGASFMIAVYTFSNAVGSYTWFALAPAILVSEICLQLLVLDVLATWNIRQPCRMSSVPRGAPFRPGLYYYIEDITAVEGGGNVEYRDRLAERWNVSLPFQYMVQDLSRIIGCSGLLLVGAEIMLVHLTPAEIFMGASWGVLLLWIALSAYFCISYTETCLSYEMHWWKYRQSLGQ